MRPSEKQIPGTSSTIPPRCKPANSKLSSNVYCYFYQNVDHKGVSRESLCLSTITPEGVGGNQTNECVSRTEGLSVSVTGDSFFFPYVLGSLFAVLPSSFLPQTVVSNAFSPPEWKNADVVCKTVYTRSQLSFPQLLRQLLVCISSSKRWNLSD